MCHRKAYKVYQTFCNTLYGWILESRWHGCWKLEFNATKRFLRNSFFIKFHHWYSFPYKDYNNRKSSESILHGKSEDEGKESNQQGQHTIQLGSAACHRKVLMAAGLLVYLGLRTFLILELRLEFVKDVWDRWWSYFSGLNLTLTVTD